jgi:hypothetical protein
MPTARTSRHDTSSGVESEHTAALAMIADATALGDAAGQRFSDGVLLESARAIARTALRTRAAELRIQVLEMHVHDEDVCANCGYPAALDGRCVCGDWVPVSRVFVMCYRDVRATISANLPANRQSLTHRFDRCPRLGWAARRAREWHAPGWS